MPLNLIEETMNDFSEGKTCIVGTCNLLPIWLGFSIPLLLDSGGNSGKYNCRI